MAVDKKGLGKAQKQFQAAYKKRVRRHNLVQSIAALATFAAGIVLTGVFAIGVYHVNGNGMAPELADGSYAVSNKLAYTLAEPSRGDVVVTNDGTVYRIIGMPNETITFDGGFAYADGKVLNESAYTEYTGKNISLAYTDEKYVIPSDGYMVLYDNRNCFSDSRENGLFITKDNIAGKIFWVFK